MTRYATTHASGVPQTEPMPGKDQVKNSAGGFVFEVDKWSRLRRFLILGCEGGSYYASERKLTAENASTVIACIKEDGPRAVKEIVEVSTSGRAPKNDPAIFALALVCQEGDAIARSAAYAAVPQVCRTATHLFGFAGDVKKLGRGWGRGLRRAIGSFYTGRTAEQVAYQGVKYRNRNGWSHRDLLRVAHVKPGSTHSAHSAIFKYLIGKATTEQDFVNLPALVGAFESIQKEKDAHIVAEKIRSYASLGLDITWEMVPTEHLAYADVWQALLPRMPLTAMIRNLGRMTSIGVIETGAAVVKFIEAQIGTDEIVRGSRMHPMQILTAMRTYAAGKGDKGSMTWRPVSRIIDVLDGAFYSAFQNVEPTGKRHLLALDVSGSMGMCGVSGMPLTAREGAAAMAMVTVAREDAVDVCAFSDQFQQWPLSRRQRLDDVIKSMTNVPFGRTDCSLPVWYAIKNSMKVDVFVVYTDSETFAGNEHVCSVLKKYRNVSGIPAKMVVCAMVANPFSIADPKDPGMLDVIGFDSATPAAIAEFSRL